MQVIDPTARPTLTPLSNIELTEDECGLIEKEVVAQYENELRFYTGSGRPFDLEMLQEKYRQVFERMKTRKIREKEAKERNTKVIQYLQSIPKIEIAANFSASEYFGFAQKRLNELCDSGQYELNEFTMPVFEMLCHYFAQDDGFYGYFEDKRILVAGVPSLSKGLALFGSYGVGKSVLMKAFAHNPIQPFNLYQSIDLPVAFGERSMAGVEKYKSQIKCIDVLNFGHKAAGVCVDDFGEEKIAKYRYENQDQQTEIVADVLKHRWETGLRASTHFTTNLRYNADKDGVRQIEARYGSRFFDRLTQNCNLIKFPNGARSFRV